MDAAVAHHKEGCTTPDPWPACGGQKSQPLEGRIAQILQRHSAVAAWQHE
jgi:hypothetical protein